MPEYYSEHQQIYIGLCIQNGYDFTYLTKGRYHREVTTTLYEAIQQNYDLSFLDVHNPEHYTSMQIREILKGLDDLVDIMIFCDPILRATQMHVIRNMLKFDSYSEYIDIKRVIHMSPSVKQLELIFHYARSLSTTESLLKRNLSDLEVDLIERFYEEDMHDIIDMIIDNNYPHESLKEILYAYNADCSKARIRELIQYADKPDLIAIIRSSISNGTDYKIYLKYKWSRSQANVIFDILSSEYNPEIKKSIINKIFRPKYDPILIVLMYRNHTKVDYIIELFERFDKDHMHNCFISHIIDTENRGISRDIIKKVLDMDLDIHAKADILSAYVYYGKKKGV